MKRFLTLIFIPFFALTLLADDRDATIKQIQDAESAMIELEKNIEVSRFIPYDIYNDAVVNTITARNLLKEKKLNNAFYYATLSLIKIRTAEIKAKTRMLKYKIIEYERDYYKNSGAHVKSTGNESAIVDANLFKKGNALRRELTDSDILNQKGTRLSKYGKESLDSIAKVLKLYPSSVISIIGHTSYSDPRKNSLKKARFISAYIKKHGIENKRIKVAGLGNKVVMKTPIGFRRINRVEIIITGIQL